jgi:uncharacterized protein (TIGR02265 family)
LGLSNRSDQVIHLLESHCDIGERVKLVPTSAQMRGLYFRSIEDELRKHGFMGAFREHLGLGAGEHPRALQWYPATDYLLWLAVAAFLLEGPARIHEGLYQLGYAYSVAFTESILGRTLLRVLSRDPLRVAQQGIAGRRQSATFGIWALSQIGERELKMSYEEEYVWLESVVTGAAKGTFDACGAQFEVRTELRGRFSGETYVKW